jgi:hypothetical protein
MVCIEASMQGAVQKIFWKYYREFEREFPLLSYVRKAAYRIMACRTKELGGHVYKCPECGEEINVYNPCHYRSCPQCSQKSKEEWLIKEKKKLLKGGYYHLVFTIPDELNKYWLCNTGLMMDLLFESVNETILGMCRNPEYLGALPGITAVLHTWGQKLDLHIHIHCIVTDGGLTEDGKWKAGKRSKTDKGFLFPVAGDKGAMGVFRGKLLYKIRGALRNNKLIIPNGMTNVECAREIEIIRNKNWNVNIQEKYKYADGLAVYLANYAKGGPIGNSRIISIDNGTVKLRYNDNLDGGERKVLTLTAKDFIRRFLLHIPPPKKNVIRHYGLYAGAKKIELELCRKLLKMERVPHAPEESGKGVFCKGCNGQMVIIDEIKPELLLKRELWEDKKRKYLLYRDYGLAYYRKNIDT